MHKFNPADYGPVLAELIDIDRRRPLDATCGLAAPGQSLQENAANTQAAFAHTKITDDSLAHCVLAGVWLLHDFLDESHNFSQTIKTPEGSFWHGIMHRREGDFSNAKYWFRNVGDHEVFADIAARVAEEVAGAEAILAGGDWDPFSFVDACQTALRNGDHDDQAVHEACLHAQQIEWEVLFDYCYQNAT
ncbi:hypothetical protein [Adhaeretor mobilis]|uniref:Uncharacterized protein n=1 Tax=Adhaeretor mobilis TaxID=1930276 RepID=A0A517N2P2_9BACT|nr:hypothetical protein [Adhaeretor mobilis]QDT01401.1 hypothetical protein HG15A2_47430 [Adhaeretor mobilis]